MKNRLVSLAITIMMLFIMIPGATQTAYGASAPTNIRVEASAESNIPMRIDAWKAKQFITAKHLYAFGIVIAIVATNVNAAKTARYATYLILFFLSIFPLSHSDSTGGSGISPDQLLGLSD